MTEEQKGGDSRERILAATLRLAAERGYDGTTVQAVSERSGLPVSSVYWHFRDKEDLLAAAIEHGFAAWMARVPRPSPSDEHAPGPSEFAQVVRERFTTGLQVLAARPDFWRMGMILLLQSRDPEPEARRRFVAVHEAVAGNVSGWWQTHLPAPAADAELARAVGVLYVSMLSALYVAEVAGHGWDAEPLARTFARGILGHVTRRLEAAGSEGEA